MKYGQIAGNKRLNDALYRYFEYLDEREVLKFVRKFREQPHTKVQVMHTYRELILGAYLAKSGFIVQHDRKTQTKTPDWSILNIKGELECIVEVVNFHVDAATAQDITEQLQEHNLWVGFPKPNTKRLYQSIWNKISTYNQLVTTLNTPYIIAIFSEFTTDVNEEELMDCLSNKESGLFHKYPELSGVVLFSENFGVYYFTVKQNPHAIKPYTIPEGSLDKN